MASPSASPPPPPPPRTSPPHSISPASALLRLGAASSLGTNTKLAAYGIDPQGVVAFYFHDRSAAYEHVYNMVSHVHTGRRASAAKAILDGYFAVINFVDTKIQQTEVEITALEHRLKGLKESKHLVEMTKSMSTLKNLPFPPDLDKKAEPADPATLKPYPHRPCYQCVSENLLCSPDCMNYRFLQDRILCSVIPSSFGSQSFNRLRQALREFELDPRRLEIGKALGYGSYRSAVGRHQHGFQYYYEDQIRQNQTELDAARRTLREFRILKDIHNQVIIEGYRARNEATQGASSNDTTQQKRNTKKDKGKKIQK